VISALDAKTIEAGEKLSADLKRQEAVMNGVKRLSEEGAAGLKSQSAELEEIKARLDRIEGSMSPSQANLKSLDNSEEIKGIGPALGSELRMLGIESVGDFLTTDPEIIGEKTRVSKEMAENLQASAQLMMIPGVDSNDADLLIEAGIKTQKQLADQELLPLSSKVNEIAKIYVEQGKITKEEAPSIEEISSWIRKAR
jgi:predicted flap endonuclease-1-like 5' DNA nuclease